MKKTKTTQQKKSALKKKADRKLQELGREMYDKCEGCGRPMVCLHHYHPKSMSYALRYYWDNLIPVCHGCHFRHHNGDPTLHEIVRSKRGAEWERNLQIEKRKEVKDTLEYITYTYNNIEKIC